jgi:hypothetical protein
MTSFKHFWVQTRGKNNINLWPIKFMTSSTIYYDILPIFTYSIRIEIIHGSHMYILFLPRVGLYVSFLSLAYARDETSLHKGLPVVKTIYTYSMAFKFHELFLN